MHKTDGIFDQNRSCNGILLFVDLGDGMFATIVDAIISIAQLVFVIWVIVVGVQKSQEGHNAYGPEPVGQRYKHA